MRVDEFAFARGGDVGPGVPDVALAELHEQAALGIGQGNADVAVVDAQAKSKTNATEEMKKSKWWKRTEKNNGIKNERWYIHK